MNRRNFLKQFGLFSAGGLLLPSALLSCRKQNLLSDISFDGKVLIIGAGAAGLYAAYLLKSKGIRFQVLEASSVYGGRLGKVEGFADHTIDTGAQWLHGRNNILGDLISKAGTKITRDDSDTYYWFGNTFIHELPSDPAKIFDDNNLPDISYKDFAHQKGFGTEYDFIIENMAGDQGADASTLSAYWNSKEEENWSSGDDDFKFEASYFDFYDREIASYVKNEILLNTVVAKIDYSADTIIVTDTNGNSYTGDKVIVTVPITVLKDNDINFVPPLPAEKTTAFSKIGMGAGMKVFLRFTSRFYNENIIGGTVCAAYADDKPGKTGNDNVLLAFVMGEQAGYLSNLGSDTAIVNALLQELDGMYNGQATAGFINASVQNWTTHPYIRGAYSYSTIGIGNARELASAPVNNKLFFAGEAMNRNGHHQTVHGATETAYREVLSILNAGRK